MKKPKFKAELYPTPSKKVIEELTSVKEVKKEFVEVNIDIDGEICGAYVNPHELVMNFIKRTSKRSK